MTDYVSEMPPADGLAAHLSGQLLCPGDDGYEEARRVWNGMYDRRPALIARCARTADVVAAIGFAREQGLTVAVRGGGHSVQGYGTCDGGLVVDLSPMKQIEVDPQAHTARAAGRPDLGRVRRGDSRTRAGHHRGAFLDHGGRRADTRQRQRLARAQVRTHRRQPARGRAGDRRRPRADCERR